jgi:hypothetical protein
VHVRTIRAALVAVFASAPALAESGKWLSLHLQPGVAFPIAPASAARVGQGVFLQVDMPLPLALRLAAQATLGALSFGVGEFLSPGTAMGGGVGLRYRLLDDDKGYLWHIGERKIEGHRGNLFGNFWVDADLVLLGGGPVARVGFDVGLGIEASLLDGVQVGPYAKFLRVGAENILMAGISLSLGVPDDSLHEAAQVK